MHQKHLTVFEV